MVCFNVFSIWIFSIMDDFKKEDWKENDKPSTTTTKYNTNCQVNRTNPSRVIAVGSWVTFSVDCFVFPHPLLINNFTITRTNKHVVSTIVRLCMIVLWPYLTKYLVQFNVMGVYLVQNELLINNFTLANSLGRINF